MPEQIKGDDPAFPRRNSNKTWADGIEGAQGMTLRQYYASQAMEGMLSSTHMLSVPEGSRKGSLTILARAAWLAADALLETEE